MRITLHTLVSLALPPAAVLFSLFSPLFPVFVLLPNHTSEPHESEKTLQVNKQNKSGGLLSSQSESLAFKKHQQQVKICACICAFCGFMFKWMLALSIDAR